MIDASGKSWNPVSYVEMLTRTELMATHTTSMKERMGTYDMDLILTTQHADTSELCEPWQNMILSLEGKTPGYSTLGEAVDAGYHHPNCRHIEFPYIEGLSAEVPDIDKDLIEKNRGSRTEQRGIERSIRE
jgi:hypothetical protein